MKRLRKKRVTSVRWKIHELINSMVEHFGEPPVYIVMNPSDYMRLNDSLTPLMRMEVTTTMSGFRLRTYSGIPILVNYNFPGRPMTAFLKGEVDKAIKLYCID